VIKLFIDGINIFLDGNNTTLEVDVNIFVKNALQYRCWTNIHLK